MAVALEAARAAGARGEVPVGAALYGADGALIAAAGNRILELKDPTAHAELLALRAGAAALGNERLLGTVLLSTLEPCPMCAGAIVLARVETLVFGAGDPKGGAVVNGVRLFDRAGLNHRPRVIGPAGPEECGDLLKRFFAERR